MDYPSFTSISSRWSRDRAMKKSVQTMAVLLFLVVGFSIFGAMRRRKILLIQSKNCKFPAIFNFGDSNSDTGGKSAAFHRLLPPNGDTFFGKPSGRYCDGRVVIDFIAEKLGLPYLGAYLDSIGTNFRHGANFATGGSTIQPVDTRIFEHGFSPISLDIQLLQFEQFKARTNELYNEAKNSYITSSLPKPEDFSKALYTLDIGQNDLHAGFSSMTEELVQASIPGIIQKFSQAVEKLYQHGARAFWVHNTGPIGCLPYTILHYPPKPGNTDQIGCVKSHNEVAQEFNKQLKERLSKLRLQLPDAVLIYVDIYSAKYSLVSEPKKYSFSHPLGYCCGDYTVQCGKKVKVNGTEVFGSSCSKPSDYISWDGVHYSHAANQWVAKHILDGSLSEPPIPITEVCHKPVIL